MKSRRTRFAATAAVSVLMLAGACERRKPASQDAAQKELERRQGDLMGQMDQIAAQQAPAKPPPDAPADAAVEDPAVPPAGTSPTPEEEDPAHPPPPAPPPSGSPPPG